MTDLIAPLALIALALAAGGLCTWHCLRGPRHGDRAEAAEPDELRRLRAERDQLRQR